MNKFMLVTAVLLTTTSLLQAGFDPSEADDKARVKQSRKLENKVVAGKNVKKNFSKLEALENLILTGDTKFITAYNSLRKNAPSLAIVNNNNSIINDNNAVAVAPVAQKAPAFLTLEHSLLIRSACKVFMTDEAEKTLNNVFTNYAHDLAVSLYAEHGDRFMQYFTPAIIGGVYGIFEDGVLKATGLKDLVGAVKQFSGVKLTASSQVTNFALGLPQHVVDVLRLKFVTDRVSSHIIGPYCVGPLTAQAIDSLNLGRLFRREVIERLHNNLERFQPELLARVADEISLLRGQQSVLKKVLERPSNDEDTKTEIDRLDDEVKLLQGEEAKRSYLDALLFRSENATQLEALTTRLTELDKKQKSCVKLLDERKERVKLLENELISLSALVSNKALVPVDEQDSLEIVLRNLPFVGTHFERYARPCPALQPGVLSSMVNFNTVRRVPVAYLDRTGVTSAFDELRASLSLEEFQFTVAEVGLRFCDIRDRIEDIQKTRVLPSAEDLENKGWFGRTLTYMNSAIQGAKSYLENGVAIHNHAKEAHRTVNDHKNWIQDSFENLRFRGRLATLTPVMLILKTMGFRATIGAVNYVTRLMTGNTLTDSNWSFAITFAVAEEYNKLFPGHMPSVAKICLKPVNAIIKRFK